MKKSVLSLFLALCLFGGNCLTAFAETAYQEGAADDLALELQKKLFVDWFGVLWSVWPQILRRLHADWQGQKGCRDLCLQQSQ